MRVKNRKLVANGDNPELLYSGGAIYLIIDEYATIKTAPKTKDNKDAINKLQSELVLLAQKGRAAKVMLCVGLQKATTDYMDSGFKGNMHERILMKSSNTLAFSEVFGTSFEDYAFKNTGKDRCLVKSLIILLILYLLFKRK